LTPRFENILQWCKTPENSLNKSEEIKISFEKGIPTKIN